MNIYLGDHFETFIREQVATGRYANASEVVREAMRQLEDQATRLDDLHALIAQGDASLERGDFISVSNLDAYFEQIREVTRQRVEKDATGIARAAS